MSWEQIKSDYFGFTRKERIAVIVLVVLIAIVFFMPEMLSRHQHFQFTKADSAWIDSMQMLVDTDSLQEQVVSDDKTDHQSRFYPSKFQGKQNASLFYFDPNTISADAWEELGLRPKTIHTIENYLAKGGRFKKPEDLQKVYGLFPDEYKRIAPFIRIENIEEKKPDRPFARIDSPFQKKFTPRYQVIDINTADTSAFIALPGIGSKLASRIVNFRDKLGGFYSIDQVGETFGLPDSTFQKIKQWLKLENISLRKININTATEDELKAHPYIRWNLAKPIVAYRNEHGSFKKIEELQNIMAITNEIFNKIKPYLTVN